MWKEREPSRRPPVSSSALSPSPLSPSPARTAKRLKKNPLHWSDSAARRSRPEPWRRPPAPSVWSQSARLLAPPPTLPPPLLPQPRNCTANGDRKPGDPDFCQRNSTEGVARIQFFVYFAENGYCFDGPSCSNRTTEVGAETPTGTPTLLPPNRPAPHPPAGDVVVKGAADAVPRRHDAALSRVKPQLLQAVVRRRPGVLQRHVPRRRERGRRRDGLLLSGRNDCPGDSQGAAGAALL